MNTGGFEAFGMDAPRPSSRSPRMEDVERTNLPPPRPSPQSQEALIEEKSWEEIRLLMRFEQAFRIFCTSNEFITLKDGIPDQIMRLIAGLHGVFAQNRDDDRYLEAKRAIRMFLEAAKVRALGDGLIPVEEERLQENVSLLCDAIEWPSFAVFGLMRLRPVTGYDVPEKGPMTRQQLELDAQSYTEQLRKKYPPPKETSSAPRDQDDDTPPPVDDSDLVDAPVMGTQPPSPFEAFMNSLGKK